MPSRRTWATGALALGATLGWLIAGSGHVAWSLAGHGFLPQALQVFTWPRGPVCWVRVVAGVIAATLTVVLAKRLTRRLWAAVVIAVPAFVMILPTTTVPYPGARAAFDVWRPSLVRAVQSASSAEAGQDFYGSPLPASLAPLTVLGTADRRSDGALSLAQWSGMPDDAGGYWYTDGASPQGRDMCGAPRLDPIALEPHWWACGMKVRPAPAW